MKYLSVYKSKKEPDRDFDITYTVAEKAGTFYIESEICGSFICETAVLGNCGEQKADELAHFLSEKAVHPLHIDDIISDMRF